MATAGLCKAGWTPHTGAYINASKQPLLPPHQSSVIRWPLYRPHCATRPRNLDRLPAIKAGLKKGDEKLACVSSWSTSLDLNELRQGGGQQYLGVDFGGQGVKGAPVDVSTGELMQERFRIPTPQPATPEAVAKVVKEIVNHFKWEGVVGVGIPAVVKKGKVMTAANIDKTWVNVMAQELFERATGCPVVVLNDADAAGFAEMEFGAGKQDEGGELSVVLMTTFGTGIGTAVFVDGKLVPNLELGHIEMDGAVAEKMAASSAKDREDLSWKKWAARVSAYLARLEKYLNPDLIILGGGVSKKEDKFLQYISLPGGTPVVPAAMRNEAGIVGAAIGAHIKSKHLAYKRHIQVIEEKAHLAAQELTQLGEEALEKVAGVVAEAATSVAPEGPSLRAQSLSP